MNAVTLLLCSIPLSLAVNNGLANTPQMGWNNWNSLGCDVSQSLLLDTSAQLVNLGLKDVGYQYVVLDDCWSNGRGPDGFIRVDEKRFPQGMKWMSAQMHDQGLLYGMYSSAGEMTCARYEGSLDYEVQDAQSWASWDVDYVKYDNCFHKGRFGYPEVSYNRFAKMGAALNATGRAMLYSLCNWGEDYVHTWGSTIANSWRISGDIYDHFDRPDALCACSTISDPHCVSPGSRCSVMNILNKVTPYVDRGFRGGWNDLDMLEVGLGGMTDDEYIAHFTMWSIVKSHLLIGADIPKLPAKALTILNNPAIIAINQDPLCQSAVQISRNTNLKKDKYNQGETQIWSGPLWGGDYVVAFLNAADEVQEMAANLAEIFVYEGPEGSAPQTDLEFEVHDLWAERMKESTANCIIDGGNPATVAKGWYNSTEISYEDGLKAKDTRLLGKRVGKIGPESPELKVTVPRHGVKAYRLIALDEVVPRYAIRKEEL